MHTAQKRLVQVTLDLMCYDDLDLENINWRELLQLEGDEEVYSSIRDFSELY
jgi:cell wall assembly regulator SMI1